MVHFYKLSFMRSDEQVLKNRGINNIEVYDDDSFFSRVPYISKTRQRTKNLQ